MKYQIFWNILYYPVWLFIKLKFGYTFEKPQNLPENYIVLSNHTTDFDPLFVGLSFKRQMFFVGSEHISRWKGIYAFAYKIINFLLCPIMRKKGTVAASTVKEILQRIRKGKNVCIFAEGVRSWDGTGSPILESTGKLIKTAKCGLVTYRITGGYFVSPMWSESGLRKGRIHGVPVGVYTKEQLEKMSVDEINALIKEDLYEDAYARQRENPCRYTGKALAKGIENLLFICPECEAHGTINSAGDTVFCTECGFKFRYDEYGMLRGAPYFTLRDMFAWQKERVIDNAKNGHTYSTESATLIKISDGVEKQVGSGTFSLGPDGMEIGDITLPFESISELAMHGKHSLVFTANGEYYEANIMGNALKFMLLYNCRKKVNNGLFIS